MNRIGEVVFCIVGMAGFLWFMRWLYTAHSPEFTSGLTVGLLLLTGLHLACYLLCNTQAVAGDGMG